jgi:hypothetical protein
MSEREGGLESLRTKFDHRLREIRDYRTALGQKHVLTSDEDEQDQISKKITKLDDLIDRGAALLEAYDPAELADFLEEDYLLDEQ